MAFESANYNMLQPLQMQSQMDAATQGAQLGLADQRIKAAQAEAKMAQMQTFGEGLEAFSKVPPEQRAKQWGSFRQSMIQSGIPQEKLLMEYDPGDFGANLERYKATPMYAELNLKRAQAANQYSSALAEKAKRNPAKEAFEQLPPENQKQIETLATKSAGKEAIKNQIDSAVTLLDDPKVSDEQKIVAGRQLLKTLNSSEGQDAVGAEEVKRLGSLLEFQMGNFTQPGKFIGRDLQGFKDQVKLTSGALGQALARNRGGIDRLYGRKSGPVPGIEVPPSAQIFAKQEGVAHAGNDPKTGPKGASVMQNGHRYDWNPKTQRYE